MPLNPKTRQVLKGRAHKLKPIVMIGINGLTEAVNKEIERGLYDHELIKIRIQAEDRDERRALFAEICVVHKAEPVQMIGSMATIYRQSDKHS